MTIKYFIYGIILVSLYAEPGQFYEAQIDDRILFLDQANRGPDEKNVIRHYIRDKDIEIISLTVNPPNAKITLRSGKEIILTNSIDVNNVKEFWAWHLAAYTQLEPEPDKSERARAYWALKAFQQRKWTVLYEAIEGGMGFRVYDTKAPDLDASDKDLIKALEKAYEKLKWNPIEKVIQENKAGVEVK